MKFSNHFIYDVIEKRPYLDIELLTEVINYPVRKEIQEDRKIKIWGYSSKYNKYVRVILLEDGETVHTAFFDRNFKL